MRGGGGGVERSGRERKGDDKTPLLNPPVSSVRAEERLRPEGQAEGQAERRSALHVASDPVT